MLALEGKKAFLIDFDGTLVDTEPLHFQANCRAFQQFGHTIDPEEYYRYWSQLGHGPRGEIERHGLSNVDIDAVRSMSREIFSVLVSTEPIPVLPGADAFLEWVSQSAIQGMIASNTPEPFVRIMLNRSSLDRFGTPVLSVPSSARGKPYPDIFIAAQNQLKLKPQECLVIEDTLKGLQSAMGAGSPCVIIKSARLPEDSYSGALAIFSSLAEFLEACKTSSF